MLMTKISVAIMLLVMGWFIEYKLGKANKKSNELKNGFLFLGHLIVGFAVPFLIFSNFLPINPINPLIKPSANMENDIIGITLLGLFALVGYMFVSIFYWIPTHINTWRELSERIKKDN